MPPYLVRVEGNLREANPWVASPARIRAAIQQNQGSEAEKVTYEQKSYGAAKTATTKLAILVRHILHGDTGEDAY